MNKLRNKTPICETSKQHRNSRFNALKHGGYATTLYQLPPTERAELLNQKQAQRNLLKR
ncbi:hypothetical protein [Frederiksenia canicola]